MVQPGQENSIADLVAALAARNHWSVSVMAEVHRMRMLAGHMSAVEDVTWRIREAFHSLAVL